MRLLDTDWLIDLCVDFLTAVPLLAGWFASGLFVGDLWIEWRLDLDCLLELPQLADTKSQPVLHLASSVEIKQQLKNEYFLEQCSVVWIFLSLPHVFREQDAPSLQDSDGTFKEQQRWFWQRLLHLMIRKGDYNLKRWKTKWKEET